MTDSGGMFSKLINPHTAKPADPHTSESKPEAPRTPLLAKSQGSPQKSKGKSKPTHQSTRQSTHQPTSQLINQSTSRPPTHIVDRPKAFYITEGLDEKLDHSILKFFQVDSAGMFRMTSSARYFKEGVGSSRPNCRWIICFLECPKVNTSCRALVKCCR
jgi:hypothetical protein